MTGNIQEFIFDSETMQAILWQYDGAERLQSLIKQKAEWYGINWEGFWHHWYWDVFNLNTANDFGLSVWAIILDLPLYTSQQPSPPNYHNFGFANYGFNFDNGNFAVDVPVVNSLTVENKRLLLKLRYFQLTTRGAIPETNAFLARLFGSGTAYLVDNLDMTITYVFTQPIAASLMYVLQNLDILPSPAGVGYNIVTLSAPSFGFDPYGLNFDNGNFSEV